ncbi:uncharacterized protein LOC110044073 [Orbicella faveolata]|uniref:uncharacterized protein LOC110044073 n=1 Tax=Orbicella faveolata TaxID=48498 RepID=UPI0009E53B59|nr:uncharacterized protein LOC110044073 [Orbicella faveolata]
MAEGYKNRFLCSIFLILASTGLARCNKLDEILEDNELLLYIAIGFLCFSVLFLFAVILMISIVMIKIQKIKEAQLDTHSRISETVIANPYVFPLPGRSLNDPTKWDQYLPEPRMNGASTLNGTANVDYLDYMDLIIMDANNVNLPRAKIDIEEKTV